MSRVFSYIIIQLTPRKNQHIGVHGMSMQICKQMFLRLKLAPCSLSFLVGIKCFFHFFPGILAILDIYAWDGNFSVKLQRLILPTKLF